jgi:hypothetical protein
MFGTSSERQVAQAPDDAGELTDMELENHAGESRRLGELWEEGPAVLVFLRHYG